VWQRKPPCGFLEKSNGVKVLVFSIIGTKYLQKNHLKMAELTNAERAVEMYKLGSTPKEVSDTLGIPAETARTYKARHLKQAELEDAFQNLQNKHETLETAFQELKRKDEATETAFQKLKRESESTETAFQELKRKSEASETALQNVKREGATSETAFQELKRKSEASATALQNVKREKTEIETALQNVKREKEENATALQKLQRTETALQSEVKILSMQVSSLTSQLKATQTGTKDTLGSQERILQQQIDDLRLRLTQADQKLNTTTAEEKERAKEAKKEADNALSIAKQDLVNAVQAHNQQIETERTDATKLLTKSIAEVQENATKELEKLQKYAAKWENVELQNKREIFLRNLKFAYGIVACLVLVQGVEASLFTQLAYKDAGFTEWWVVIVGGILAVGFQGIGLFLTVNRGKKQRTITEGYDDKGKPIFKKTNGVLDMEAYYDMSTMQILCVADFAVNCFVFFQNTNIWDAAIQVSARLALYSALAPLGIYFTSEVMLYILDKREKLNS
jgi:hypothetical protein